MISKEGFSVVAPMRMMSPFSTWGEESVLLEFIEPVKFVDEENDLVKPRLLDHLFDFLNADTHCAQGDEGELHVSSHEPAQSRLSYSARSPEYHGGDIAFFEEALEQSALAKDMLLSHEIFEAFGSHPVCEGLSCGRGKGRVAEEVHDALSGGGDHPLGGAVRFYEARRIGDSLSGDIEARAVSRRCADKGNPEGDVYGPREVNRLHRDEPLVVVTWR